MKVYEVIIADFDLYAEYGLFKKKSDAEKKLQSLKENPVFLWKKYLKIIEKELF